jgi:hypothetical protein
VFVGRVLKSGCVGVIVRINNLDRIITMMLHISIMLNSTHLQALR